jgi:HPt (histidine-containing phosphotransfer) domain-containing protein
MMNQSSSKRAQPEAATVESFTLDCDHVLTHAGGDPELLIQLCDAFLREVPLHMESLRGAILARNHVGAARSIQHLRTSLMVFGTGQPSSAAEALEQAIRDRRLRLMRREWKQVAAQLQILIPQVQRLMLEMSNPRSAVQ